MVLDETRLSNQNEGNAAQRVSQPGRNDVLSPLVASRQPNLFNRPQENVTESASRLKLGHA